MGGIIAQGFDHLLAQAEQAGQRFICPAFCPRHGLLCWACALGVVGACPQRRDRFLYTVRPSGGFLFWGMVLLSLGH